MFSFAHFLVRLLCLFLVWTSFVAVLLIVVWVLVARIVTAIELMLVSSTASIHIGVVHVGLLMLVL